MKRIIVLLLVLAVIGLVAFGVHRRSVMNAKKKRQAIYEAQLRSFTQALQPGMTRKQVEDYLHAKNVDYSQECCVVFDRSVIRHSYDDLVKIGQEDAPWFCSEQYVYVALQFKDYDAKPENIWQTNNDLDTLKAVSIYSQLGGCL